MAQPPLDRSRPCVLEVESGRRFTWGDHEDVCNKLAGYLLSREPMDGKKLVVYGHNSHEWIVGRSTASLLGMYFVPMNWHLAPPEVAYICDNSEAAVMMVDAEFLPLLSQARSGSPEMFEHLRHTVVWGAPPGTALPSGAVRFEDVVARSSTSQLPPPSMVGRAMLYTGGTSGKPKAVLMPGSPPNNPSPPDIATFGPAGMNLVHQNVVHLVAAPLYHGAPNVWQAVAHGQRGTSVVMRKFDSARALDAIGRHGVMTTFMPPILVKRITDAPLRPGEDLSSLRAVTVAGAPCPMSIKEAALKRGIPLYEFYGSSEFGLNTVLRPEDMLRKPNSCGRVAPGLSVKVFDEKTHEECPPGKPGLLYVKREMAYYRAEQKTRDSRHPKDPAYGTVGDVAYIDSDGFVFICDRKIDMIISGGANIYPAEIESVLHLHPAVADVAVFGTPDPEYGERVHAAVELKEGHAASAEEIKRWLKGRIASFKAPREISFHSDFPRTPSGKLLKRQLRSRFWKGGALAHTVQQAKL
eukprot:TRINITY_DN236_c0_g1_i2.p1 TRINITY_DN236_c0_g1~~TRINITY_DN236_c0_g1_i2.p1  ORF type:complete len:543 (+),score=181.03 TRINITY_DN236_c0_g1_i2:60-1631(+)